MTTERELLIGGEEMPASSGKRTTDLDPYSGKVMATVAAAGPEDATRAVDAAAAAFDGVGGHHAEPTGAGCSCGRRTRWMPAPQRWRRL